MLCWLKHIGLNHLNRNWLLKFDTINRLQSTLWIFSHGGTHEEKQGGQFDTVHTFGTHSFFYSSPCHWHFGVLQCVCVCVFALTILHSELPSLLSCGDEQSELLLCSLSAHTDLLLSAHLPLDLRLLHHTTHCVIPLNSWVCQIKPYYTTSNWTRFDFVWLPLILKVVVAVVAVYNLFKAKVHFSTELK